MKGKRGGAQAIRRLHRIPDHAGRRLLLLKRSIATMPVGEVTLISVSHSPPISIDGFDAGDQAVP